MPNYNDLTALFATSNRCRDAAVALVVFAMAGGCVAQTDAPGLVNLSTSKQLVAPAPGNPQRVNSLPLAMAVSPDGRWVATIDAGYGTEIAGYMQSITVLDTSTGSVREFPDARTLVGAKQTFFAGLAFSPDGTEMYASLASSSAPDPKSDAPKPIGNGIVVYRFANGALTPERFLKLAMVPLAAGKHTDYPGAEAPNLGIPYPAAIRAFVPHCGEAACPTHLLVAENLADSVIELDAATGAVVRSFDVSNSAFVPGAYPVELALTKDGSRAFVALWNASEVAELDLRTGKVTARLSLLKGSSPTAAGSHPCALLLDERGGLLYVALSNRDAVAAVEVGKGQARRLGVRGYFDTRLPHQTYFGAEPDALAFSADRSRLYAANMGSNAVAVLDPRNLAKATRAHSMAEPVGFIPTELMPTVLAVTGGKLYIATAKGKGTGPNGQAPTPTEATRNMVIMKRSFTYAPTLLFGSIAAVDEQAVDRDLPASTEVVLESNRMKAAAERITFSGGTNPIHHVIYILKENRTYDQILGDLAKDGKPVGNGDPSLTMYGAAITPNQHKLVLQFGVLDNFFDSGEVSGSGHVWSNAGIGTDYLEKTWQGNYRGGQRTYDYEGMVANGYPLLQHIPDVNEAKSGYLWTNLAAHGKTLLHFGEYISSTFCSDKATKVTSPDPIQGAMSGGLTACATSTIKPGAPLPDNWGGGTNAWPWAIPRLASNTATKPELVGHFAAEAPDFNLRIPDQIRVNIFLRHLEQWKRDRASGHDTMPNYVMLRLPNDHTEGTRPGGPTPQASIADNDLAIGRAVEAISHSAFWDDTAFFIVEDDAQNGGDHVDAHRSLGIVISKYAPHAKAGEGALVDSRFYSTVSMLRTMETLLGVPPMNNNDAFASMMSSLFTGPGDQAPFVADTSNRDNRLIYTANKESAPGASASSKLDFTHADKADSDQLNLILWKDAKGEQPPPPTLLARHHHRNDDDD